MLTRTCVVLTIAVTLAIGCKTKPPEQGPGSVDATMSISMTRTQGVTNTHFSALVQYSSNYVTHPVWQINPSSGPLPPGLEFNTSTGEVSGTPTETGTWNVEFQVRDRDKGTDDDPRAYDPYGTDLRWYYENFEIAIYDHLDEGQ